VDRLAALAVSRGKSAQFTGYWQRHQQVAARHSVKTNQYAIAALKDRRATLAGEIEQFKQGDH
jgi:cell division protein FtsB